MSDDSRSGSGSVIQRRMLKHVCYARCTITVSSLGDYLITSKIVRNEVLYKRNSQAYRNIKISVSLIESREGFDLKKINKQPIWAQTVFFRFFMLR